MHRLRQNLGVNTDVEQLPVADEVIRKTQIVDLARSMPLGILLPLETSVLLTIAIKHFDASPLTKGLIAASGGLGLLVSPFVTSLTRHLGRTAMSMASAISLIGMAGFLLAATGPMPLFVIGVIIGLASANSILTLVTFTYDRNFPAHERGKRVGHGLTMKVAVSATLALAMGAWLNNHLDLWWIVVLGGAAASLALSFLHARMPTETIARVTGDQSRVWPHFELLNEDRQLRLTLIAWMFMGFGNLMLLPLRVEYLAQPKYGIEADPAKITLLTVAIPSLFRLVCTPVFGRLFDRISFFASRIIVNLLFALYVVAFFTGSSDLGLWIGAVTIGIAIAGGDLMWMLWVTKFAPPGRVADYMGLHAFFTGTRAVSAPLVAFLVIDQLSLGWVAVISAALMVVSALVLVPEVRAERSIKRRKTDVEGVIDPIRVVGSD